MASPALTEDQSTAVLPLPVFFLSSRLISAISGYLLIHAYSWPASMTVRRAKMLGNSRWVVLSKTPRSSVDKAFQDFYLDSETTTFLAQSVEFANRKGIYPALPGEDKIQYGK